MYSLLSGRWQNLTPHYTVHVNVIFYTRVKHILCQYSIIHTADFSILRAKITH